MLDAGYYDNTGCFKDGLLFCTMHLVLELALFFCHCSVSVKSESSKKEWYSVA